MRSLQVNENMKKLFWLCMLSVFIWGMAAHGYGFLHSSFSHDSLAEFNSALGTNSWKIQLGRIWAPLYRNIFRTDLILPWMVGLLALFWIGLSVYLTVRMLPLRGSAAVFLTAGIFTVNQTVTATAVTYLGDLDANLFGMLCSVAAVYLWQRYRFGFWGGMVLIAGCMGFYQSYLSVAIVLILLLCIGWLLDGQAFRGVFRRGLLSIGMLIGGGILYALMLVLVWKVTGLSPASGSSNSLDVMLGLTLRDLLRLVAETYTDTFSRLFGVVSPYAPRTISVITAFILLLTVGMFALALKGKGVWEILLSIVLAALLPLGMNFTYVLSSGMVHDLMVYGIWLSYLPSLALSCRAALPACLKKTVRWLSFGLVGILLYANVQTANVLYLKKDMEQDAFLSYMTRVVYSMESCEGYTPGQTPVVFVGTPAFNTIPGFEDYIGVTGADYPGVTGMSEDFRARAYFQFVLNNPAVIPGSDVFARMRDDPRVEAMPDYPQSGSIAMIDDILVVKLSKPEE